MYTPSQLRLLRIAVIVMGVILLLGFATVIGRIVYLLNAAPKPPPAASSTASEISASVATSAPIELPRGAIIRHVAISGNRLAIHYEAPSGAGIRIFDLAAPQRSITLPIIEKSAP
jgi:hypothetical protein